MDARANLVDLLQRAHAGELAAAKAYAGHWRSVRDPDERTTIRRIEGEELAHRACLGRMLTDLGATPKAWRERLMWCIGTVVGPACHVSGWYIAMYGAGRIEQRNVWEYVHAATYARECGHGEMVEELLVMAEAEWDHEKFFRDKVLGHRLARVIRVWKALPPRADLRIPEIAAATPSATRPPRARSAGPYA